MESHEVQVRGVPIRWLEDGDGDPLVLVHGIPTGPALWRHVAPRVRGPRCLAFEMVGYADSIPAGRDRDISVARQADYLIGWLDEIGVSRAVLAGRDLGGGVVQIAAVRRPDRCAGLFLTNAIAYDSWPIPSVKAMRAGGGLVRRLPVGAMRSLLAPLMLRGHDDRDRARESLDLHLRPYREHGGPAALVRQERSLDVRDTMAVADRLRDLDVPARVVWGEADQFQKVAYGERLAWDLNAPLRRIAGGRHFVPEDHPEIIAEELTALLADVSKAG
ncbi:MAG: alpha/beta fold hydrolase [Thermoleophilia bacterium]